MEGMNVDTESNEGKLFAAVVDVLDEIALEVEDLTDEVMELGDGLDVISDDLGDVEDIVYDEDEDDYEDEETLVTEDVPCKLSQYGKDLLASKTERALSVKIDLRLCCARDVDIREGDRVVVSHQGQTFELFAGTRFVYPTHAEVSVRRSEEAGNDGD